MARAIKLINAPVGLFDIDGVLVLKTEYSTQHEDGAITPDCYIVGSGEYFWGGVDSVEERNNLMVTPIDMPTLTPPNEPLTIEQLREMDGEPVWVEDIKHWALIDIEKGGQWDGVPFAIWAENGMKFTYNIKNRGLHCYRRPPEGEV